MGLERSRLFQDLSPAELEKLRAVAERRVYGPKEVIFSEGDHGDGLYVIESGTVSISAMVGGNVSRPLARLGAGDFFGEMAVVDNAPRSATATTMENSAAYFISREDLVALLDQSPRLAVSLLREFSHRMRDFNKRYVEESLQAERLTLVGRFARSIIHDFKNPLNVIGLASDMVGADGSGGKTAATRIRKQVERLTHMINELLEFTRGSQKSVALAPVDFQRFIERLASELAPDLQLKNVELVIASDIPAIAVPLDPTRLTHVFYNLCHNAVEAMPEGGKIMMRFAANGEEMLIELEDTGGGIAPEIAPRLFEAFATFGKSQGTGLGLSICKRIIDDHQGSIEAAPNPGKGALFRIGLPLSNQPQQPLAP